MPKVTAIKPQKSKKRVNIFLDGKFSFGIDLESFVKAGIALDQDISDEEVEKIIKEAEFQKTYNKLLKYVTLRPRSKKEIEIWLRKYKVHVSIHKELYRKLNKLQLVNDREFAIWWIEQRNQFRPKGERVLKGELVQKGIDRNIIDDVLDSADIDEEKMAEKLLLKNKYKWERLENGKRKEKMINYLARRGFSWDVIKKVVKRYL